MAGDVVIVGAGECAAQAAFALRDAGFDGRVTLVGDEPELPYERPPLSKRLLVDGSATPALVQPAARYAERNVEVLLGRRVVNADRNEHTVELDDGMRRGYGALVFATGARARPLELPGGHLVSTLRSLADTRALRGSLVGGARVGIIGAGFIGLEVAAGARSLGCDVTVLERLPRVLARGVPETIGDAVHRHHRAAGVDVRCGVSIVALHRVAAVTTVEFADGTAEDFDGVVSGIGATPNTELASAIGLKVDNGVVVDALLRTDDPDVFAAGDCCSFPHPLFGGRRLRMESWRNAVDQGVHVAAVLTGSSSPFTAVPWFWSDQFDHSLHVAGLADIAVDEVIRRRPDGAVVCFGLDGDDRIVSASGFGPGAVVARDVRVGELLIARGAVANRSALADPSANLKSLLKDTS